MMDKRTKARFAKEITALMEARALTQVALAKLIVENPSRISEWLNGVRSPSSDALFRLAMEAEPPKSLWFLEQAGITEEKLIAVASHVLRGREGLSTELAAEGDVVLVSRYRFTEKGKEQAGKPVPVASEFLPNPGSTICIQVDKTGDHVADSPTGLFLLDESERGVDPSPFWYEDIFVDHDGSHTPRAAGIYAAKLAFTHSRPLGGLYHSDAFLLPLTDNWGHRRIHVGLWSPASLEDLALQERVGTAPESENNSERDAWQQLMARGLDELRLEPGWTVLGRILGRLKLPEKSPME